MINLNINYSSEYEVLRIKDTISKLNWFKEKGYTKERGYKISFPESFSTENSNFKNEEYIKKCVLDEYSEIDYEEQKSFVDKEFGKIKTALEKFFTETNIESQNKYEVCLTKYGIGGSYNLPNKIIINIKICKNGRLAKTIIHEIIHLSIEDLIQKYNIGQWEKERVIDLIFDKIAPELNTIQKLPIETEEIDNVFEENYPNIEKILGEIKN